MAEQADRFRRLSEVFDEVVALGPDLRESALAELCAGDGELEAEVRKLLQADAASDGFVMGVIAAEAGALHSPDMYGTELGPWRIVEPIGEGGMGTVYLAERADGAYEASAAVKLVRGGIPSPFLAESFRAERQILAGLSHPGVAQLLDGGSTSDGTPYLVMEYIDGAPITEWCDTHDLGIESRLTLFLKVCDAVAYAHRALVAHRDLKPSNILVTNDGEPKLLDFGIAKLIDAMGEGGDGVTQSYGLMTPAYASPEQVSGERAGVSADMYSLGVLLYEMLAGKLPIETRGLTPVQLISRVVQEVPAVMSAVVDDGERKRRLSGDLDAIVSRALRKEPEARYASIEALAEDIRLHLDGHPVRTRHDDWRYRTGKAVRRNAGVVSGGLLMLLLGISFTINTVVQARAVGRERDRAEAQRATAERVSGFLEELFTEADPNATSARDITVRDILDRGATRVMTGLVDEPESRAALAMVIGRVYLGLGEYEAAEPLLDSALAARRRMPATSTAPLGDALLERGVLAYDVGDYELAIELQSAAVDALRQAADGDDAALAGAMSWLAVSMTDAGDLERGELTMREAVAMNRRLDPEPNVELAVALKSLQDVLREVGKIDEAVTVGEEALAMSREVFGNDDLETAHALNQMGSTLNQAGRAAEAIPFVEEGLAIRRAAYDGAHVEIAASLGNLSNMFAAAGRQAESIAPRRASAEMLQDLFPETHPYVVASTTGLGGILLRADSLEAAEPILLEGLRLSRLALPSGHPNLAMPMTSLGALYRRTGRYPESLGVLLEAYDVRVEALAAGHWHIAATGLELGLTYEAMGRESEAERYLVEAHEILEDNFGAEDSRTERARAALDSHLEARED